MNTSTEYRLRNQYDQLEDLIHGLSAQFMVKRHEAEKWSIHENIAHLARYHEIFMDRTDRILMGGDPSLNATMPWWTHSLRNGYLWIPP